MAFTIRIFEKDEYIYSLLKYRLGQAYPEAYIINPMTEGDPDMSGGISNYSITLYDQRFVDADSIDCEDAVPLLDSTGTINCRRVISSIKAGPRSHGGSVKDSSGIFIALIPFVDIEAREDFIRDLATREMSDSSHSLRLDLTTGFKSSPAAISGVTGNMSQLLKAGSSRRFKPEDILGYCAMDRSGFLTPGACDRPDELLDTDPELLIRLSDNCSRLVHCKEHSISALLVLDGIRTGTIPGIVSDCDKVMILCPRGSPSGYGYEELRDSISKNMQGGTCDIIYRGNIKKDDTYEQIL